MSDTWRKSLETVKLGFVVAAQAYPDAKHAIVLSKDEHDGACLHGSGKHSHHCDYSFCMSRKDTAEKLWWHCRFTSRDGGANTRYFELARDAGRCAKQCAAISEYGLNDFARGDDDLWTVLVYRLAWAQDDEAALKSFSELLTPDGMQSVTSIEAGMMPDRLRSELAPNAFAASAYAADILLAPPSKAKSRKRSRTLPKDRELTAKQVEAVQVFGECKGNKAAAARRLGIDRSSLAERLDRAWEKLGKRATKHATKAIPRDRRGQAHVSAEDDRRQ